MMNHRHKTNRTQEGQEEEKRKKFALMSIMITIKIVKDNLEKNKERGPGKS